MNAPHDDNPYSLERRPRWAKGLPEKDYDLAMRGVFSTLAAAAYTGLSEATIRQAITKGELVARKQGKGWRIQKRDLMAFFRAEGA